MGNVLATGTTVPLLEVTRLFLALLVLVKHAIYHSSDSITEGWGIVTQLNAFVSTMS